MNTRLALCAFISAIASSPMIAADNNQTAASVDLYIARLEVSAALKQYEKARLLLSDAQLDRELQQADSGTPKDKIALLDKRIEILTRQLTTLRVFANDTLKAAWDATIHEKVTAQGILTRAKINDSDPDNGDVVLAVPETPNAANMTAFITAKTELVRYTEAKARYLRAKVHLQKSIYYSPNDQSA